MWTEQEWQISKTKQDRQLENIEKGLGTLGEVALAMDENLKHQDVLLDAIEEKVPPAPFPPRARGSRLICMMSLPWLQREIDAKTSCLLRCQGKRRPCKAHLI